MDINEIRLVNTRYLMKQFKNMAAFADAIDRERPQVSQLIGKNPTKNIGHQMARTIELHCGKPRGWLDHSHDHDREARDHQNAANPNDDTDILLLARVTEAVLSTVDDLGANLTARQQAKCIGLLYAYSKAAGGEDVLDPRYVVELMVSE